MPGPTRITDAERMRAGQPDGTSAVDVPMMCIVGNIGGLRGSPGHGTKHFSRGTKVYVLPPQWGGDGGENVVVMGKHRGGGRMVRVVVRRKTIARIRLERIYSRGMAQMLVNGSNSDTWYKSEADDRFEGLIP